MREFRIGRLGDGFAVTWHEDGKRRRFRLASCTRKEAEAEALDVIRRETIAPATATVADLWEAYVQHLGARPTAKTMGWTGLAVLDHFGALRPDQITVQHSRDYVAARLKAGRKRGAIWTELGHLRSCLSWSKRVNLISAAPFIELPQKPAPKDRYLTRPEIDKLLAADCEPHIRLAILLMLTTAARVGAVLDLTWTRVDLDRGQINLRADLEGPRKGRAVVPINATLRAALEQARRAAMSEFVIEWAGDRVRSIRTGLDRAIANAGLSGISAHVLRHTAAVHMAEAGVPMHVISQYLGHSNTQVTERIYARFSPQFLQEAAAVLDFGNIRRVK